MTISKRNTVLSLLLSFISIWSLQAQSFRGKIISSKNGTTVPFANVMIKGSTIGVATDFEGVFSITIPSEYKNETLVISAVGFANTEYSISKLGANKVNIITIGTQEYKIDEVAVEATSKVLYGAIKKCSKSIAQNYITTPYSCDFTYVNNNKKAQGSITDITGYQRTTFKGSYRKITYQFNPNDNSASNIPYFSGRTNMEDLLSFDLVRTVGNIIDEQNVYDFDLELSPKNTDKNLWIIHFTSNNPKLHNTGDVHATTYEGELYIVRSNFAINKVVIRGHSEKRSIHGKSISVSDKSSNYVSNLSYEVSTTYKAVDGKYRMDKIEMSESYTNAEGEKKQVNSSLSINLQKEKVVKFKVRDYYVRNL